MTTFVADNELVIQLDPAVHQFKMVAVSAFDLHAYTEMSMEEVETTIPQDRVLTSIPLARIDTVFT